MQIYLVLLNLSFFPLRLRKEGFKSSLDKKKLYPKYQNIYYEASAVTADKLADLTAAGLNILL